MTASPSLPRRTESKSTTETQAANRTWWPAPPYQGFLDAGEGRISFDEFATRHLEIIDGAAHADAFLTLMGAAMTDRG